MAVPNTALMERQGDLGGLKIAMSIDDSARAHLMKVLTDLYRDPEMAVIRELSTNARDSHIEAGIDKPIEVNTPSSLHPYLTIKDFGIGLSKDDIENIYSKYGASTKRENNDLIGMLGLGCKSPLTYTNQFSLTAVKGGFKTVVSVSRIEDGTGIMEVVSEEPTDEPPGVEVVIPAKYHNSFIGKATELFKYWEPGSVLLNDRPIKGFEGTEMADNIYFVEGNSEDKIVMGGVAYPAKLSNYTAWNRDWAVIAFVEMGAVDFTPSREELHLTPRTNAEIERIRETFDKSYIAIIEKEIATAKTYLEAYNIASKWQRKINTLGILKYKGHEIPKVLNGYHWVYDPSTYQKAKFTKNHYIDYKNDHNLKRYLVVTGFDKETLSPNDRGKLNKYAEIHKLPTMFVMITGDKPWEPWVIFSYECKWEDVKKIGADSKKKIKASYPVWDNGFKEKEELDQTRPICYMSPADDVQPNWTNLANNLPDVQFVSIPRNRWVKFKRDYPKAQPTWDYLNNLYSEALKALTEYDKIVLGMDSQDRDIVKKLKVEDILDPEIHTYIKAASETGATENTKRYRSALAARSAMGYRSDGVSVSPKIVQKYPLIDKGYYYSRNWNTKHLILYLNAAYKEFYQ